VSRLFLLSFAAAAMILAQRRDSSPDGDADRGQILFTKIGCYECHGFAGQGGRDGARIVPMPLKAQDMIRYVRRPPGQLPAYTGKGGFRPGPARHLRLPQILSSSQGGEGYTAVERDEATPIEQSGGFPFRISISR
jgi:hypothetical protein